MSPHVSAPIQGPWCDTYFIQKKAGKLENLRDIFEATQQVKSETSLNPRTGVRLLHLLGVRVRQKGWKRRGVGPKEEQEEPSKETTEQEQECEGRGGKGERKRAGAMGKAEGLLLKCLVHLSLPELGPRGAASVPVEGDCGSACLLPSYLSPPRCPVHRVLGRRVCKCSCPRRRICTRGSQSCAEPDGSRVWPWVMGLRAQTPEVPGRGQFSQS